MLRVVFIAFFIVTIIGCKEQKPQSNITMQLNYTAPFSPEKIGVTEALVRKVSRQWGFQVLEKDRQLAKFLSNESEAFGMFLTKRNNSFTVYIGNIGNPNSLVMNINQDELVNFTKNDIASLSKHIISELKKIGIIMKLKNEPGSGKEKRGQYPFLRRLL